MGLGRQENGITEPITIQKVFEVSNNKQKRKLVFIFSDSILNQMDKERLSDHEYTVKVEGHGGCTIEGMYTHLPSVLPLKPQYILLHLGTNDCTINTSDSVLKRLITLKKHIENLLPSCKVCLSLPTLRTDNTTANTIIKNLNTKLKKSNYMLLDNSNIMEYDLGKKGLHFNRHGTKKMAGNIISLIKRF